MEIRVDLFYLLSKFHLQPVGHVVDVNVDDAFESVRILAPHLTNAVNQYHNVTK